MKIHHHVRPSVLETFVCCALVWGVASACSLAPGPPPPIRWFSASSDRPVDAPVEAQPEPPVSLRLRRVTAARHLGERIAWRRGVEYGFHDLARWTELPDAVVARALERALFESGAFVRDGRADLALDVDVRAFEEVRDGEGRETRAARVELAVLLSGSGDRAWVDRTLAAEVPLEGEDGAALATAIRLAIAEVTEATLTLVTASANGP
jgi:ABC-type uncharacterized transport system auxiliary subunit